MTLRSLDASHVGRCESTPTDRRLVSTPMKNYYEILGVTPGASLQAIKTAYRARAMICHPDRSGSHQQMLDINEAYEILSNRDLRNSFDAAWAHQADSAAQERAGAASRHARVYGSKKTPFFGWKAPTVAGSSTGTIFLIVGGIVGMALFHLFFSGVRDPIRPIHTMGAALCGAWIGRWIHGLIGSTLSGSSHPTRSSSCEPDQTKSFIQCPTCSEKLRVPQTSQSIRVTCPSCKNNVPLKQPIS